MEGRAKPPSHGRRRGTCQPARDGASLRSEKKPVPYEKKVLLRRVLTLLLLLSGLGLALGCSDAKPPQEQASQRLGPVHWPAVEGAARYRVQAWHERRLLFEVTRTDTMVVLTPSLARAVRPFGEVEIQVRAIDAAGAPLGEVRATRWRP